MEDSNITQAQKNLTNKLVSFFTCNNFWPSCDLRLRNHSRVSPLYVYEVKWSQNGEEPYKWSSHTRYLRFNSSINVWSSKLKTVWDTTFSYISTTMSKLVKWVICCEENEHNTSVGKTVCTTLLNTSAWDINDLSWKSFCIKHFISSNKIHEWLKSTTNHGKQASIKKDKSALHHLRYHHLQSATKDWHT